MYYIMMKVVLTRNRERPNDMSTEVKNKTGRSAHQNNGNQYFDTNLLKAQYSQWDVNSVSNFIAKEHVSMTVPIKIHMLA